MADANKGDGENMKVRSRLVARQLKARTKEAFLAQELFSAMPPWEMIKALFSLLVTDGVDGCDEELEMGIFDISRAHFMPKIDCETHVEIPDDSVVVGLGIGSDSLGAGVLAGCRGR